MKGRKEERKEEVDDDVNMHLRLEHVTKSSGSVCVLQSTIADHCSNHEEQKEVTGKYDGRCPVSLSFKAGTFVHPE